MGRLSGPQRHENDKIMVFVRSFKDDGDQAAFQEIVRSLHGFLQHLALKKFFYVPGSNHEDIYQEGLIALANKAIPDYDEQKGPFLGFAKLCIRRHIITVLKSANNGKNLALNRSMSIDASVCEEDDDGPIPISGLLPTSLLPNGNEDIVDAMLKKEAHRSLKSVLLDRLTSLETHVLELYLQNMSYKEIEVFMNKRRRGSNRVDTKTIDNALCRIKKKAIEIDAEIHGVREEDADPDPV